MYHVFSFRVSGNEPKMRLRGDANLPAIDVFVVSSGHSDQTVSLGAEWRKRTGADFGHA